MSPKQLLRFDRTATVETAIIATAKKAKRTGFWYSDMSSAPCNVPVNLSLPDSMRETATSDSWGIRLASPRFLGLNSKQTNSRIIRGNYRLSGGKVKEKQ